MTLGPGYTRLGPQGDSGARSGDTAVTEDGLLLFCCRYCSVPGQLAEGETEQVGAARGGGSSRGRPGVRR